MIDNTSLIETLIKKGQIRLNSSELLRSKPSALPNEFDFLKIEGMLLGLSVGDALGATTESMVPKERRQRFGEITEFVPGRRSNFKPVGVATDDTQLSFWTLEQIIHDNGLIPDNLAKKFCRYHINGIGKSTKEFIRNYKDNHVPWYESGIDSLGNGALMRIAPVILPYLRKPGPSLYADAGLDAMITHNAYGNVATCVAFVNLLWQLLSMTSSPDPEWWIDSFCSAASSLEGSTNYQHQDSTGENYKGPLWKYAEEACGRALDERLTVLQACDRWGSGANLFETLPSVLYILARHGSDPEAAIVRAVNDTRDNDSIAAIVGAAVGALHGLTGIPVRWLSGLEGNIRAGGNHYQVFRLTLLAKSIFWLEK